MADILKEKLEICIRDSLSSLRNSPEPNIIAEIKKASPSRGVLIEGSFLPFLEEYEEGEAVAISVVTEEDYFQGSLEMFREVRKKMCIRDSYGDNRRVGTSPPGALCWSVRICEFKWQPRYLHHYPQHLFPGRKSGSSGGGRDCL